MEITKRLKVLMEDYSFGPSQLADHLEVPRSTFSHLLSGRNKPSLDLILKLVEKFPEVDLYWLLFGKEKNELDHKLHKEDLIKNRPIQMRLDLETSEPSRQPTETLDPASSSDKSPNFTGATVNTARVLILKSDGSFEEYIKPIK